MKKQIISAALAAILSAGIFSAPAQEMLGSVSVTAEAASAVSAPKTSKKAGTYSTSGAFTVKLTAADGAQIYYSTGGDYKLYTKALRISRTTTVRCYAKLDGVKSKTVSYTYKLTPKVTFSMAAGSYDAPITVKLSSTASGVKFYYTLDGSKPSTSSALYDTTGIKISGSAKLRVLAVKSGWTNKYFSREYTIEGTDSAASSDLSGVSILDDYKNKYAYNTLTSTQKKVYAVFFDLAGKHAESGDVSSFNATGNDVKMAYWAFDYDNPQFFWLGNGYAYTIDSYGIAATVTPQYSRSKSEAERLQKLFDEAADKIITKALAQDNLFDRVKVIHDSIAEMTEYTTKGISAKSEADGPLIYGLALCEGYSKAFMYLCQAVGIPCVCVAGYANEPHMWNMLQLDGEWYNMDVTWDDAGTYDYFCIPTKKITEDHSFDNLFPIPSAASDKYSYNTVMGIEEYSTADSAYRALLSDALKNWDNGVYETQISVKSGLMSGLTSRMNSSLSSDLTAAGIRYSGWSASYSSKTLTLTLKH